jgi:hypothetical protein
MFGQIVEIDHAAYQRKVKKLSADSLRFIIKDAKEAMQAMPLGPKAGYYQDEVFYCCDELERRKKISSRKMRRGVDNLFD